MKLIYNQDLEPIYEVCERTWDSLFDGHPLVDEPLKNLTLFSTEKEIAIVKFGTGERFHLYCEKFIIDIRPGKSVVFLVFDKNRSGYK